MDCRLPIAFIRRHVLLALVGPVATRISLLATGELLSTRHAVRASRYCARCVHVNGNRDSETQSRTCVICKLFFACGSVGSPPADKNLCM
ncbi:hypothetical protein MPTK2_4g20460 [Marchantia polymorpha subsp. ruderalis]